MCCKLQPIAIKSLRRRDGHHREGLEQDGPDPVDNDRDGDTVLDCPLKGVVEHGVVFPVFVPSHALATQTILGSFRKARTQRDGWLRGYFHIAVNARALGDGDSRERSFALVHPFYLDLTAALRITTKELRVPLCGHFQVHRIT